MKYNSLDWLAKNYIWKFGLRNWNWKIIIDGIITEHKKFLKRSNQTFEKEQIEMLWFTFLKVAKIHNLY